MEEIKNLEVHTVAGSCKCNADAAIFADRNSYGIGLVLRDEHGNLVAARSLTRLGVPPALEAEAAALLAALEWLLERNDNNVHIELDCLNVVEYFHSTSCLNTEVGNIISRCQGISSLGNNFGISFIRRQANRAAHVLARASRLYASRQDFDFVPPCLEDIILNEMI